MASEDICKGLRSIAGIMNFTHHYGREELLQNAADRIEDLEQICQNQEKKINDVLKLLRKEMNVEV